jgi:hypothetical protein
MAKIPKATSPAKTGNSAHKAKMAKSAVPDAEDVFKTADPWLPPERERGLQALATAASMACLHLLKTGEISPKHLGPRTLLLVAKLAFERIRSRRPSRESEHA